jgi:DNA-binding Lrp family transcriptional regulator
MKMVLYTPRKLDPLNVKILEALGTYSPRNISEVARKLGIPEPTLRKRLKQMFPHIFYRFYVNLYHTNMGLKKGWVFAEATPGYEDLLFDALKTNDFWIYVGRYYGFKEGCLGVYTIPERHSREFEQYVYQVLEFGFAREINFYWSTCFHSVHSRLNWYDEKLRTYIFHWDVWVKQILGQDEKLPHTLIEPQNFPIKVDEVDLFILKELEKDPTIRLADIAKMLGISQQLVSYHYRNHIIKHGLIESFEVLSFHFTPIVSDMFVFILKFGNLEKLTKFAASLLDKPYVGGMGKILGENALIVDIYLPRPEFRRFINALSELVRKALLKDYSYVIRDLNKVSRQTIPYEHFEDGKWIYNHEKHIRKLRSIVQKAKMMDTLSR